MPNADVALEAARFRPPFRHLALLVQVPNVDLPARMEAEKGAPLDAVERAILEERARVAVAWLEAFAPDRYKVAVQDELPEGVAGLTEAQRIMLGALAAEAERDRVPTPGTRGRTSSSAPRRRMASSSGDAFAAHLPRLPGSPQRTARRLAAGQPRPWLRDPAAARRGG